MRGESRDVLVIGGGVIGLSIARHLAGSGAGVTLFDPAPGSGATRAAAGMLAPVSEAHYGEEELLGLNLESARLWPDFASGLEDESGLEVGYDEGGTLAVAYDPSDKAALEELHRFQEKLGLESRPLGAGACRRLEPALAPGIAGGLDVPSDHQVDPRRLEEALLLSCKEARVSFEADRVAEVVVSNGVATGVRTAGGELFLGDSLVLAAGWQSGQIKGLPQGSLPPVRPVKGQIVRLRLDLRSPRPSRTLRAVVRGNSVYLVPRRDGELVLGATSEEMGEDVRVTAGAVYGLLRDAQAILPSLLEAELVECWAGLRPGSPDNAPLIGPSGVEKLVVATGHYRHGILLAPITAAIVAEVVSSAPDGEWTKWPPFDPRRFHKEAGRS